MLKYLNFGYDFYPMGQGLFASGGVGHRPPYIAPHHYYRFNWVFDCGTTSAPKSKRIRSSIDWARANRFNSGRINLAAISHFDADHINGFCQLLESFKIDTLLLPYAPLFRRLELAFAEGISAENPLMEFYLNPVRYLLDREGGHFRRVILVPSSEGEGPPAVAEGGEEPPEIEDEPVENEDWELDEFPEQEADNSWTAREFAELRKPGGESGLEIRFLQRGAALSIKRAWEFVPYNEPLNGAVTQSFISSVDRLREDLLNPTKPANREGPLAELKKAYVKGDRSDDGGTKHLAALAAPNIHIFSASLVYKEELFADFDGTDLCLEIPDFEKFSRLLVNQIKKTHTVEKWAIDRCVYMDRKIFDSPESIPSLPSIKEPKHAHQHEIRLCVSIIKPCHEARAMVSLDEPLVVPGKKAWKQCRVFKRKGP